ncbi:mitochondrial inner membrane signal peptidase [Haematococcus lacustris]
MRWLLHVAWCVPVAAAFTDACASVVRVDGTSMQPTLNTDIASGCEWVLVEKVSYKWLRRYSRGDVAVFWAPDNPHQQLVKRLVGLEGDAVWELGHAEPTPVPQGRCWVEGDHAAASGDSRNLYGPIHLGLLEGRVTHVVWPPHHIRQVARHVPQGRLAVAARATGEYPPGL